MTYKTNTCKSFTKTQYPLITPYINSLSSYYSIVGTTSQITIFGINFREYSILTFGSSNISFTFINSSQVTFYIPISQTSGTYAVQITTDNYKSNAVNFTIETTGSYWSLTPTDNSISNANIGDINMICSVFNKYIQSYSLPGAYLYTDTNNYPIYTSISNYQNFYSSSSSSSSLSLDSQDVAYIISPGYQLVVYNNNDNGNEKVIDIPNNTSSPIYSIPSSLKQGSYCNLYFFLHNKWNLIKAP